MWRVVSLEIIPHPLFSYSCLILMHKLQGKTWHQTNGNFQTKSNFVTCTIQIWIKSHCQKSVLDRDHVWLSILFDQSRVCEFMHFKITVKYISGVDLTVNVSKCKKLLHKNWIRKNYNFEFMNKLSTLHFKICKNKHMLWWKNIYNISHATIKLSAKSSFVLFSPSII